MSLNHPKVDKNVPGEPDLPLECEHNLIRDMPREDFCSEIFGCSFSIFQVGGEKFLFPYISQLTSLKTGYWLYVIIKNAMFMY